VLHKESEARVDLSLVQRWILILGVCSGILVGASIGWIGSQRDLPNAHIEGFEPPARRELARADNGYERLLELLSKLEVSDAETRQLTAAASDRRTPDEILPVLERNTSVLADIRRVLSAPDFQYPEAQRDLEHSAYDLDPLYRVPVLARLLATRARVQADQGDDREALESAFLILELGHRLLTGRGATLVHGMIAVSTQHMALAELEGLLPRVPLTLSQLRELDARLIATRIASESWKSLWAVEYAEARMLVRLALAETSEPTGWHSVLAAYTYHPNRMLRQMGHRYREFAEHSVKECFRAEAPDRKRARAWRMLQPNGSGEILVDIATPNLDRFRERACALEVGHRAMRVLFALHAYHVDQGAFPEDLATLVPRYLTEVPGDPFGTGPLRYSRSRRRVWSIGADGSDAGGLADRSFMHRRWEDAYSDEPTYWIEGSAESPE